MAADLIKEDFDYTLYKMLAPEDRKIIDEYIPKMSAGEINSFIGRLLAHYTILKTNTEILEITEDFDTIVAFERYDISKQSILNNFIEKFTSSTKSSSDVNDFFLQEDNFNFVVKYPQFYMDNSPAFLHIIKYFNLSNKLKMFLVDKKELYGLVWE